MKNFYEKPDAEYIELKIKDLILNAGMDFSFEVGEDEEEGFG